MEELLLKEFLETAKEAAFKSGSFLKNNFLKKHQYKFKTEKDLAIKEDEESEKIILNIIKGKYHEHNFYSEEIGFIKNKSPFTWYIDPLDGTNNYFAGIPYFSVSIALLKNDDLILGVVFNPVSGQFFEASKDSGAFLNGKKISPSKNNELPKSVCSFIQGHSVALDKVKSEEAESIKKKLSTQCRRVISTWAPALDWCLLASGGIDGLVSFESELEDMYAGYLIAKEAGIEIYEYSLYKFFATNNKLFRNFLNCFSENRV